MKENEREAARWFLQAKDDFRFVEWLAQENVFFDKGCFMSQQAGEKALKAALYATGKRRVIGHSLFEMIRELTQIDSCFQALVSAAKRLDRFYITTRYPNGIPGGSPCQLYDEEDLAGALQDLRLIVEVCSRFLREKGIHE